MLLGTKLPHPCALKIASFLLHNSATFCKVGSTDCSLCVEMRSNSRTGLLLEKCARFSMSTPTALLEIATQTTFWLWEMEKWHKLHVHLPLGCLQNSTLFKSADKQRSSTCCKSSQAESFCSARWALPICCNSNTRSVQTT